MDKFRQFHLRLDVEMRPYEPGEDMQDVFVREGQTPKEGDMIARDSRDRDVLWLVPQEFAINYREVPGQRSKREEF
jgi:hypothetical protein